MHKPLIYSLISIFIIIVAFLVIPVLTHPEYLNMDSFLDLTETGEIGDTIGGISGPIIAILASFLTFAAFYEQYKANNIQREDLKKERFENKLFTLIDLHKQNVNEFTINNKNYGRASFVHFFSEFELAYNLMLIKSKKDETKIPAKKLSQLAYLIFYYGIESVFNYQNSLSRSEYSFLKDFVSEARKIQDYVKLYSTRDRRKFRFKSESWSRELYVKNGLEYEFWYIPFDGHVNKLGHYYRHLFQSAKFILSESIFTKEEKYYYIKLLRSQLTDYEQLLLYYNSTSMYSEDWEDLFRNYKLIKNIPLGLAKIKPTPEERFKDIIEQDKEEYGFSDFFEYQ